VSISGISGISGTTPPHVVHPHGKHAATPGHAAAAPPPPPPAAAKADNDGDSDAGKKQVNLKA
jgi:hypothetical protein